MLGDDDEPPDDARLVETCSKLEIGSVVLRSRVGSMVKSSSHPLSCGEWVRETRPGMGLGVSSLAYVHSIPRGGDQDGSPTSPRIRGNRVRKEPVGVSVQGRSLGLAWGIFSFASSRVPIVRQASRSGIRPLMLAHPLQPTQGTCGNKRA